MRVPTPFRRIKWQAIGLGAIGTLVTGTTPWKHELAIFFAFLLASLFTRWIILYKRYVDRGAPERRKTDATQVMKGLKDDVASIRSGIHQLAEDTMRITGFAQLDIRDLRKRVESIESHLGLKRRSTDE